MHQIVRSAGTDVGERWLMDLLAPLFAAAGIVAGIIPIVLHMLRRAPTREMPFSVVRFLKPSQPRLTKRSSIEHWPLMLLRILAILLIAFAFARPFLRLVVPAGGTHDDVQSVTILIDKSASMRRDGIYEQVQQHVQEAVASLEENDLLSIATFSESAATLVSREKWATSTTEEKAGLVQGVIENYEPDWMGTNIGSAMQLAADELARETKDQLNVSRRRLVLITDFQRGSDLDELRSGEWPGNVEVELQVTEPDRRGNAGVTFVSDRRLDRTRVRVTSAADSKQQEFRLQPFDAAGSPVGAPLPVTVAPGQRRSLLLPPVDPGLGKIIAGLELLDDDHPFDNVIDLPELQNPVVKVAHVGPSELNDPESMRYYLQRVLDGNVDRDVRLIDLIQSDGVIRPIPDDVQLVVATGPLPAALQKPATEFLARAGTLLAAPPSVEAADSLTTIIPIPLEFTEAGVDEYAMLSQIDFEHPIFSAFSDVRFADFSSIRFWHHRSLAISSEDLSNSRCAIVATFDDGQPAVVEIPVGEGGRMIILASGWHPTDSQLALSTRFPALLTRILSLASPAQKTQLVHTVGDIIRPGQLVAAKEWSLLRPDGETVTSEEAEQKFKASKSSTDTPSESVPFRLETPGRYTITGQTEEGETTISLIAGLAPAESRTERLPIGQLQVLGIGVEAKDTSSPPTNQTAAGNLPSGQLNAVELEREQKWWRGLLLAGMALLLTESIWARQIEKRRAISDAV